MSLLKSAVQRGFNGQSIAFGFNDTITLQINSGTSYTIVMEAAEPSRQARKIEFPSGDGSVYGAIYTDYRSTLNGSFYILSSNISNAKNLHEGDNALFTPGDLMKFTISGDGFLWLTSPSWRCDTVSQSRQFGERRMVAFSATSYANI